MKSSKEIVERALKDPAYAEQLRETAKAAAEKGINSDEHKELVQYFISSENELEELLSGSNHTELFGFTTVTTTTTYTTAACTTTGTTTTTTGN
ncbi:hypothetical protein [Enterobacter sp. ECC-019]|uniref:hypothetical protein n=1 Tax=Enterobacter sp. ECC-019 TaxID=3116478 RepID=UPI003754C7C8